MSGIELSGRNMRILFGTVVLLVGIPPGYTLLIEEALSRFLPIQDIAFLQSFPETFAFNCGYIGLMLLGAYWVGQKLAIDLQMNLRVVTLVLLGGICVGWSWVQGLSWALSLSQGTVIIKYKLVWSEMLFDILLLLSSTTPTYFFLIFTGVSLANLKSRIPQTSF